MAHYAQLDSHNKVVYVFVGRDEDDLSDGVTDWEQYYAPEGFTVKRTSYNTQAGQHTAGGTPFRGNYAGIGYTYDETLDAFIPPKPFESWVLDESIYNWVAPIPYPKDGGSYEWDETAGAWVEVIDEVL
jgi:hypothetical protein